MRVRKEESLFEAVMQLPDAEVQPVQQIFNYCPINNKGVNFEDVMFRRSSS